MPTASYFLGLEFPHARETYPLHGHDTHADHGHEEGGHCQGLAVIQCAGLGEESIDGDGDGRVVGPGQEEVAPNSPMETVNANTAATTAARATMGKSTSHQVRHGPAPRTAAASCSRGGMDASAGCRVRTTKGKATRLWARGMS